jgi:hypothetical protein
MVSIIKGVVAVTLVSAAGMTLAYEGFNTYDDPTQPTLKQVMVKGRAATAQAAPAGARGTAAARNGLKSSPAAHARVTTELTTASVNR